MPDLFRRIVSKVAAIFATLDQWEARSTQRRYLSEMTDNQLKDIGLTRGDAYREIRKWPWEK